MNDSTFVRLQRESFDGEDLGSSFVIPTEVAAVIGNPGRTGCTVCTRGGSEIFDVKGYPDDVMGMLFPGEEA